MNFWSGDPSCQASHFWLEGPGLVSGLLGTDPPDLTLESVSPSPFQVDLASKQGQIRRSMSNQCRVDVESMPNRPLKRGRRGGFEGEVRGSVPNKLLTSRGRDNHDSQRHIPDLLFHVFFLESLLCFFQGTPGLLELFPFSSRM